MNRERDFRDAERMLIDACQSLLDEGIDDVVGYEIFVRIFLDPWLTGMRQVAQRLAASDPSAAAGDPPGTSGALTRMRFAAERQFARAVDARDARLAAKLAFFACGVQLAIDGLGSSPLFGLELE
jgi:hypothetical protein